MNPDRRDFLALGVGALAVAATPAALRPRAPLVRRSIPVMGTVAEVAVRHRDVPWAQRAIDAAFDELRRVESAMTRFRPDSDVGRLNDTPGGWVTVSEDTAEVLALALVWSAISWGRFDPCLGRAIELWDVAHRVEPPAHEDAERFAGRSLWTSLEVDRCAGAPRARLLRPEAAVDLGGIAKGFAVDAAGEALRRHGVFHGLVNVGGDLVALGVDASEEPWRVGIRSPEAPARIVDVIEVSDAAVATSGDYLQFFQHAGRRYHHLLDPDTGRPRKAVERSLTVCADRCVTADAAATTVFGAPATDRAIVLERAGGTARVVHQIDSQEVRP